MCHGTGTESGENRAIACEQCDKLYHATCIRPIMTTIPKYGWKCKVNIKVYIFFIRCDCYELASGLALSSKYLISSLFSYNWNVVKVKKVYKAKKKNCP